MRDEVMRWGERGRGRGRGRRRGGEEDKEIDR